MSLDSIFETDDSLYLKIYSMDKENIKRELFPVTKRGENFDLVIAREAVVKKLRVLFNLTKKEKSYLNEFSNGNFLPKLLFDNDVASRAQNHPMARWKVLLKQKQDPK